MQRYFIAISYQGTHYHGWQRQLRHPTIQGSIEETLNKVYDPTPVVGSSRTDAGVHATHQVAHLDLDSNTDIHKLIKNVNSVLPFAIYLQAIHPVANQQHARFDAIARSYVYYLTMRRDPFRATTAYYYPYRLDLARMNQASQLLLGQQDCKSFCKTTSTVPHHSCHITQALWAQQDHIITFSITANRFLHSMVRALVGTLLQVGSGRLSPTDFSKVVAVRDRTSAGSTAPSHGLFLTKVSYPPALSLHLSLKERSC